jgi:hypothetical protein
MFLGQRKVKAPNEHHFFIWLAIQDRCWTSERLQRHGLCALCNQGVELISHLLFGCVLEIWFKVLTKCDR